MTKSKRRIPPDRLSELPDSLIFHIFWFLPMDDFVRTAVLSSRWKTLWTTTPYLNFDFTQECNTDIAEPRNFVNRALLRWRGIKILKFKIKFGYLDEEEGSLRIDFDLWIRFAAEKKVEELYLHGYEFDEDSFHVYEVPQWLYSCSSLKVLSLIGFIHVQIHGNVPWSQLKSLSLTMNSGRFRNCEHVINQVLCGAPHLEVLILGIVDNSENLSIQSSSLRKLSIKIKKLYFSMSQSTELRIWTPNLETLEISGDPCPKCLLMNVPSLTHATLDFYDTDDDIIEETLRHILPTIQHVETVTLSSWCIEVLAQMTKKDLVSPFSNVKLLKLKIRVVGYEQIVGVLEIFPKMKMLVLLDEDKHSRMDTSLKFDAKSCLKFVANLPKSFLLQLRTVKITWAEGDDSIFPFTEILLKYASNLEKMVIRVKGLRPASNSLFLASKKLLNMPRSSPNCTVDLL